MATDDRSRWGEGEIPPPMDESWWAAVLKEQDRECTQERGGAVERGVHGSASSGSAEDWAWARKLYEDDDVVDLAVTGHNRGGLLVEARGLRGFVPVSHLIQLQGNNDEPVRQDLLSFYLGKKLTLKIIEYDPERGRLVLSERAGLAGKGRRCQLLSDLRPGERLRGVVTNITRFGVFVDLGGLEGLIHVSELSWGRVRHPADVVSCGQTVDVCVLAVDKEQGRVALSLKELSPDPWATVESRYTMGQIVEGVVTNVVQFGAFVGIEQGLEGLIHISELGDGSLLHPRNVVREGERVRVRVIHMDAGARRLGLSLRQVSQRSVDSSGAMELTGQEEVLSSS